MFGLDLADVKTFLDEIPKVPISAYKDLKDVDLSDLEDDDQTETPTPVPSPIPLVNSLSSSTSSLSSITSSTPTSSPSFILLPMFNQPGVSPKFFDRLRDQKVSLENSYMGQGQCSLQGTIRVQNLAFEKQVSVRYTTNEWMNSTDVKARYVPGSCDGFSDNFRFVLDLPELSIGQRLQFCVRYESGSGQSKSEYWDNNDGKNFVFHCVASNQPSTHHQSSSIPIPNALRREDNMYSFSPSAMSEDPWARYL